MSPARCTINATMPPGAAGGHFPVTHRGQHVPRVTAQAGHSLRDSTTASGVLSRLNDGKTSKDAQQLSSPAQGQFPGVRELSQESKRRGKLLPIGSLCLDLPFQGNCLSQGRAESQGNFALISCTAWGILLSFSSQCRESFDITARAFWDFPELLFPMPGTLWLDLHSPNVRFIGGTSRNSLTQGWSRFTPQSCICCPTDAPEFQDVFILENMVGAGRRHQ